LRNPSVLASRGRWVSLRSTHPTCLPPSWSRTPQPDQLVIGGVAGMIFAGAPRRSPGVGTMSPRMRGDAARALAAIDAPRWPGPGGRHSGWERIAQERAGSVEHLRNPSGLASRARWVSLRSTHPTCLPGYGPREKVSMAGFVVKNNGFTSRMPPRDPRGGRCRGGPHGQRDGAGHVALMQTLEAYGPAGRVTRPGH
jgi:hypothetical protein